MNKQISKKQYTDILREIVAFGEKYNLKGVSGEAEICRSEISDFSIKLLFVGQTSAGKSAFINSLLGRGEFLKEEQLPETSIATELVYDHDECVELIDDSGDITKSIYSRVSTFNPDDYNHFKYHIDNEYVRNLVPFTIVDMPGTESGIERHNKAILRYICQGNAFILVIDSEKGTVQESVAGFINEIKQYDDNLGIIVAKADVKPDIEEIRANIEETAALLFGKKAVTIAASKHDDNRDKFNKIIDSIDPQNLFEQKFRPNVLKTASFCLAGMESAKSAMHLDDDTIKKEIEKREKRKVEYEKQFTEKSAELSRKLKNHAMPQILADVRNALHRSLDTLAACAMNNPSDFSRVVNNILRPVFVTSTQQNVNVCFDDFTSSFNFSKIFSDEDAEQIAQDIKERTDQFTRLLDKIVKTSDEGNISYKLISGALAITTTVIAPWLEILIFFLPEIIKILSAIFSGDPLEKAKEKLEIEIIPQIIEKLEPKIGESLVDIERERVAEIRAEIDKMIAVESSALEEALKARTDRKAEYEKRLSLIDSDLAKIRGIVSQLEAPNARRSKV